jgi:hypothetical protein
MTVPNRRRRRFYDHLVLVADALVLSVVAGAAFVLIKDFLAIPAAWIDPSYAFLTTMCLSSTTGALGSWLIHRRASGARGLVVLAAGLAIAVTIVFMVEVAMLRLTTSSIETAMVLFTLAQVLGLLVAMALLLAGIVDLVRQGRRRLDYVAIARTVALSAIIAFIALRFLPESAAQSTSARMYAFLGLATLAGALAAGLGNALLIVLGRRKARRLTDSEELVVDRRLRPDRRRNPS